MAQPQKAEAQVDAAANIFNSIINFLTTGEEVWEGLSKQVLEPLVLEIADRMLRKLSEDTINWATGGFDGEAGFINNYGELLRGTEYEFLSDSFSYANSLAISQANNNQGDPNDPGGQAQSNWELFQNAQFLNQRQSAEYVAQYAGQNLLINDFNNIVSGNAQTLDSYLAQSGSSRNDFNNDLASGGLAAYALLGELPNSPTGLRSVINSELSQGVVSSIDLQNKELSVTTGVLSKKTCEEEVTNADGKKVCKREVVETPGDQIASQLNEALKVDTTSAANLSDGLVSALIQSVGRVADGLIQNGLGEISNEATKAFFSRSDAVSTFNPDGNIQYQSEYDVLGINPGNIDINGSGTSGGNPPGAPGGGINQDLYIGGPEDIGNGINDGPQIIINFQEVLENNIQMAVEEREAYEEIRSEVATAANVLFEFDKCIPGPDTGWEERYQDVLPIFGDDEGNQINEIGLNETKTMVQDPSVTIPGGSIMQGQLDNIFDTLETISNENQFRYNDLQRVILSLGLLKTEILADFNVQKIPVNENLVLFSEDWDALSATQKQELLGLAIDSGYYNNPEYIQGENILFTSALENDEEAVKQAVFSIGWWLWRNQTDPARKLELRQIFHALTPNLSNQQFIVIAQTRLKQVSSSIEQSYGSALDCMVFKAYAVGTDRATISGIVNNEGIDQDDKIFELAEFIDEYDPAYATIPPIGNVLAFYNNNSVRNDAQLKTFLESEAALQNQPNTITVLKTGTMTAPSAIENSILGFNSPQEKEQYFNDFYPDDDFPYSENRNKLTIKDMYRVDRAYAKTNRAGSAGSRGHLFCRNAGSFEVINRAGDNDTDGTNCWKDFYSASKLDYQLIVSGINN